MHLIFFSLFFFPNRTQYNLEELQSLCYKQMELCLCTSSQRCLPLYTVIHRKLYVYMAASSLVCPGWFLWCCYKTNVTPEGGENCSTFTFFFFYPLTPVFFFHPQSPLSSPTSCPHSVKHCKRFELCKGLFLNNYFVYNVKRKVCTLAEKNVWNHSFI